MRRSRWVSQTWCALPGRAKKSIIVHGSIPCHPTNWEDVPVPPMKPIVSCPKRLEFPTESLKKSTKEVCAVRVRRVEVVDCKYIPFPHQLCPARIKLE